MENSSGVSGEYVKEASSDAARTNPKIAPTALDSSLPFQITSFKLTGKNYLKWSRSVQLVIRGKGRFGYLDGTIPKPPTDDASFADWDIQNSMVMAWLIHSMEDSIADIYLLYPTAQAIWEAVTLAYSDLEDSNQMFELRNRSHNLRQDDGTVTQYYGDLTKLWQELDLFTQPAWTDPANQEIYRKLLVKERTYDFLSGLHPALDDVRGRILSVKPLPNLDAIFSEVRREEQRRRIMLGGTSLPASSSADASAMAARVSESRGSRKPTQWCEHCNRPHHTKATCWKLHGKPADWVPRSQRTADSSRSQASTNSGSNSSSTATFSQAQLDQIGQLLSSSTSLMAHGISSSTSVIEQNGSGESWIIDSGASEHMSGVRTIFSAYTRYIGPRTVTLADGSVSPIFGIGTVILSPTLILRNVLFVPKLSYNLLSISKLTLDSDCVANFSPKSCVFQDRASGRMIGRAIEESGLYQFSRVGSAVRCCQVVQDSTPSRHLQIKLLHQRLGHPSFSYLRRLFPSLFRSSDHFVCEICQLAKHTRIPFPLHIYRESRPFALVHSDLWGPSRVTSISNKRWFISFIDDHTRVCWVFLLRDKSEVTNIFSQFHNMVLTQFDSRIQMLRTDNGTEYFNSSLNEFSSTHGIVHQSSCVDTPQQNGVSERKNRHLLEVARALLFMSNVPKTFWGDALLTACYLINRLPSRLLKFKTPISTLQKSFPKSHLFTDMPLRIFGCSVFVHIHDHNRSKLDPRSHKCVFVGYSTTQKGYRCYSPSKRKYFISRDIIFFENQSFYPPHSDPRTQNSSTYIYPSDLSDNWEYFWISNPPQNSVQGEKRNLESNPQNQVPIPHLEQEQNQEHIPHLEQPQNLEPIPHNQQSNPQNLEPIPHLEPNSSPINPVSMSLPTQHISLDPIIPQIPQIEPFPITYSRRRHVSKPTSLMPNTSDSGLGSKDNRLEDLDVPIALRKGTRSCTKHPISNFLGYSRLSQPMRALVTNLSESTTPTNIDEALRHDNWRAAVFEEIKALEKNGTWDIVQRPEGKTPVGCRWLFTIKCKSDGSIDRYKARLVAKGYTQTYGVDYQETFAPVAKINTIRVLLSLAANLDWPLQQLDVKNAFLNGDLEEEVYMDLPPGFNKGSSEGKVCRLRKALYGLKQSPKAWFDRFAKTIQLLGYKQAHTDHTLFYRREKEKIAILIVYVDDIIITGNNIPEMERIKRELASTFEMKDLGNLRFFLGMEVARSKDGISVSQRKYVLDLLKDTGLMGCKPVDTPMDPNIKLEAKPDDNPVDKGRFQRLVGRLIYLAHTRPDISFPVSCISQFMHSPYQCHLDAANRILRYLKGSPGRGLLFRKQDKRSVEVFVDADWASCPNDRRSTSGYCSFVFGNLVTWRSKKQSVVARSSAEAELRSTALGICEALWIKQLLEELQIEKQGPMSILCDNKAAISISHNPVHHDRTKHVEIDRHFIKEKIEAGILKVSYVPSSQQTADVLTKALFRPLFERLIDKLGMYNIYHPA